MGLSPEERSFGCQSGPRGKQSSWVMLPALLQSRDCPTAPKSGKGGEQLPVLPISFPNWALHGMGNRLRALCYCSLHSPQLLETRSRAGEAAPCPFFRPWSGNFPHYSTPPWGLEGVEQLLLSMPALDQDHPCLGKVWQAGKKGQLQAECSKLPLPQRFLPVEISQIFLPVDMNTYSYT